MPNGKSPNWKARHTNQVKRHRKQAKKFHQENGRPLELRLKGRAKQTVVRARLAKRVMNIYSGE